MRFACPGKDQISLLPLAVLLLFLHGCAATGSLSVNAVDQKNSLPLLDRDITEEVKIIVVPPFYQDRNNWRGATHDVLSSVKRVSVVPTENTATALRTIKKDLSVLSLDERPEILVSLAKLVRADAVMNGAILTREGRTEIILQLLSSRDSRVLWWQAVDLTMKSDRPTPEDQKTILSQMLSSLLASVGKRDRPTPTTPSQIQSQPDTEPKTDAQRKTERKIEKKSKPEKKTDKRPKPAPSPHDIGPM